MKLQVALLLLAFSTLVGCNASPEPSFLAKSLQFDERLLGTWSDPDYPDPRLIIEPRDVPLQNGRVHTDHWTPIGLLGSPLPADPREQTVRQYLMFNLADENDEEPQVLWAFLHKLRNGEHILSMQVVPAMSDYALVVPLHIVYKIQIDGGNLLLWAPEPAVSFVSTANVIGVADPKKTRVDAAALTGASRKLVTDVETLFDIYNRAEELGIAWELVGQLQRVSEDVSEEP